MHTDVPKYIQAKAPKYTTYAQKKLIEIYPKDSSIHF